MKNKQKLREEIREILLKDDVPNFKLDPNRPVGPQIDESLLELRANKILQAIAKRDRKVLGEKLQSEEVMKSLGDAGISYTIGFNVLHESVSQRMKESLE